MIFDDTLKRNRVFAGPWGSKNQSTIGPESLLALNLAPRASWRPLGLDFWTLSGSQNGPPRPQESKLKFEAFLKAPKKQEHLGRRQGGGPSGRGLLGSLPTVDAGLLRSCACHSAFGNPKSLRSRPPLEPEGSVAGFLEGSVRILGPESPSRTSSSIWGRLGLSRSGLQGFYEK